MVNTVGNIANYHFDHQTGIFYWQWLLETENIDWIDMQKAMLIYAEESEKNKAKYHIIDERQQRFVFIPEYQTWIDQNIAARTVAAGCKKFALLNSDNIFIEVAGQQIFEEKNASKMEMKMFRTTEDAEKWIMSFM